MEITGKTMKTKKCSILNWSVRIYLSLKINSDKGTKYKYFI